MSRTGAIPGGSIHATHARTWPILGCLIATLSLACSGETPMGGGAEVDGQLDAATTRITDLDVVESTATTARLSFTATGGAGELERYEVRFAPSGDEWSWEEATTTDAPACSSSEGAGGDDLVHCRVTGLTMDTEYRFQTAYFEGPRDRRRYGPLSNVALGRTSPSSDGSDDGGQAAGPDDGSAGSNQGSAGSDDGSAGSDEGGAGSDEGRAGSDDGSEAGGGGGSGGGSAPSGAGWDPQGQVVCNEDFSRFTDWNGFMSGAGCISNKSHLDSYGRNNIDVDSRGLWYRYKADPQRCGDQIVGQANIPLPNGTREVWLEWDGMFSSNFDTVNPNCGTSPAPDFKYVLVWLDSRVSCGNRRAELKMGQGSSGNAIAAAAPGFPQCDDAPVNGTVRVSGAQTYFDGRMHHFRVSFRILGGDRYEIYAEIDGSVTHDYVTSSIPDAGLAFERIMLGSNRNLGATSDMYLHWRNMKVRAR